MVEYVTKTENGNKFDYAQWTSDYKGWLRNKEILKFDATIKNEGGEYKVKFSNIEKKYLKALAKLTSKILQGAEYWIPIAYNLQVDNQEDRDDLNDEILRKRGFFLQLFLDLGIESYVNTLAYFSEAYKMEYQLKHLKFENGKIIRKDGSVWNTSGHWDKDGLMEPVVNDTLKSILPCDK